MSLIFENEKEESARRRLFVAEFARLGEGARVRKFLHVLTTSKVRQMLRSASKPRRME